MKHRAHIAFDARHDRFARSVAPLVRPVKRILSPIEIGQVVIRADQKIGVRLVPRAEGHDIGSPSAQHGNRGRNDRRVKRIGGAGLELVRADFDKSLHDRRVA